ncbi:MAG: phytoene/squalene synthase family protein [Bdellovibrio bacteriovorus]
MPRPSFELEYGSPADLAAGRALLRGGSRSFYAASFLLPHRVREPATALYAFCRLADDAVDLADHPRAALADLNRRLDGVYAGRPLGIPADRALADVVRAFAIPRALLEALIEGFAWDAEGRGYEDLSALYGYCARVAGTVGAMMALLMGVRDPVLVARACDLGVAMQLSNIARDVGEDAGRGRLYLPRDWMRNAGMDPDAWLASPTWSPALGGILERLLAAADQLYGRADLGIAGLPLACRPGIAAARRLYAEIGQEVRRRGLDSLTQRAVVSPARKLALLAHILGSTLRAPNQQPIAPLEETRFLVESIGHQPRARRPAAPRLADRLVWVLELFERLERQERSRRNPGVAMRTEGSPSLGGLATPAAYME